MNELQERRRLLQPACPHPTPALFLDRDGVLIEDKHHLCDPEQVALCQGSQALVSTAHQQGWPVVVITNQSGIARGYFDWPAYERVTDQLLWQLGESAPLAGIYANGHGPDAPERSWRKPSPAMLLQAARELNLDLQRSVLVGDRQSDLEAGVRARVQTLVHVMTGHGYKERPVVTAWSQRELQANAQNHPPEVLLLNSLLDFPPALLCQDG
jgi:D-glycero-D-manno-heptose 1,7-bisphosphate phosphatase